MNNTFVYNGTSRVKWKDVKNATKLENLWGPEKKTPLIPNEDVKAELQIKLNYFLIKEMSSLIKINFHFAFN